MANKYTVPRAGKAYSEGRYSLYEIPTVQPRPTWIHTEPWSDLRRGADHQIPLVLRPDQIAPPRPAQEVCVGGGGGGGEWVR